MHLATTGWTESLGRQQAGVLMLTAGGFWRLQVSDCNGPTNAELCYLAITRTRDGQIDGTGEVLNAGKPLFCLSDRMRADRPRYSWTDVYQLLGRMHTANCVSRLLLLAPWCRFPCRSSPLYVIESR